MTAAWVRSLARWAGALPLLLAAAPAWACPYCIGKYNSFGVGRSLLVVAIVLLPFAVSAAVIRTVRAADSGSR